MVVMKTSIFWDITPSSPLKENRRCCVPNASILVPYRLILRPWKWRWCFSETSVNFQWITQRYIPEYGSIQIHITLYGIKLHKTVLWRVSPVRDGWHSETSRNVTATVAERCASCLLSLPLAARSCDVWPQWRHAFPRCRIRASIPEAEDSGRRVVVWLVTSSGMCTRTVPVEFQYSEASVRVISLPVKCYN
jgi:hypothetical protein